MFYNFKIRDQNPVPFNQKRFVVRPESSITFKALLLISVIKIFSKLRKGKLFPNVIKRGKMSHNDRVQDK
jgi:hypothetical protein